MSRAVNLTIKPLKNRKGKPPDSPESMIRRFIRKSKKAGILDEAKKRKYYKKPSQIISGWRPCRKPAAIYQTDKISRFARVAMLAASGLFCASVLLAVRSRSPSMASRCGWRSSRAVVLRFIACSSSLTLRGGMRCTRAKRSCAHATLTWA